MKVSPNRQDINQIRRMHGEGLTVADISRRIGVQATGVQMHLESSGLLSAVEELTPQQRGAITRKKNAEASAEMPGIAIPREPEDFLHANQES
jgi:hypothetical protein